MIIDLAKFKKKLAGWRKNETIDYILVCTLIVVLFMNFIATIWSTGENNHSRNLQSGAIYCLYQELQRYNDNHFGEEVSNSEPTTTQSERAGE